MSSSQVGDSRVSFRENNWAIVYINRTSWGGSWGELTPQFYLCSDQIQFLFSSPSLWSVIYFILTWTTPYSCKNKQTNKLPFWLWTSNRDGAGVCLCLKRMEHLQNPVLWHQEFPSSEHSGVSLHQTPVSQRKAVVFCSSSISSDSHERS